MKPVNITTSILGATVLGAALLTIGALGFSQTTGEMSKLAYSGNLWCVSNWLDEENAGKRVYLSSPDGRPAPDHRLKGKEDWIRIDQVSAESKEEAEKLATRTGWFESSDKTALRDALDKGNKSFFTGHFNSNATSPGPCLGTGLGTGIIGKWVNDGIREACFEPQEQTGTNSDRRAIYNSGAFTADQINKYLSNHFPKSPLNGKGQAFVDAGKKYGVNPGFMLGMTNAESSLGGQCLSGSELVGTNNAFGMGGNGHFKRYSSYEEGIDDATRNAATDKYKNLNGTMREFRLKWCGYETESESSGIVLSDGSKISYPCSNGKSVWTEEVGAILSGLIADNPAPKVTTAQQSGSSKQKVVVLDPGHGTSVNSSDYESKTQLEIAQRTKTLLEKAGYKVLLTRSTTGGSIGGAKNADQDNINRANIANQNNADLAIRFHSDDHTNDSFWVLYPDKTGKDRTGFSGPVGKDVVSKSTQFAKVLANALKQDGFSGITQGETMYGSDTKADLLIFSAHSKVPVVTLELYGHKSSNLRAKYASAATQQKVASSITKAVQSFLGSSSSASAKTSSSAELKPLSNPQNPNCPAKAPPAGPAQGQDYRSQVAQAFMAQLDKLQQAATSSSESGTSTIDFKSASKIVQVAQKEIGTTSSGKSKYGALGDAQWCAYFATWVLKQAGLNMQSIAGARATLDYFKSNGHMTFSDPSKAQPGDIVVWARSSDYFGHIGVVAKNENGTITTIEGNTSHAVRTRSYDYSEIKGYLAGLYGFGRW